MENLLQHISTLQNISGTNSKKEYLKNNILSNPEYREYLRYTYDKITYKFNTKKLPIVKSCKRCPDRTLEILEKLSSNTVTGNAKEEYLKEVLSKSPHSTHHLVKKALDRNLRIGLNAKVINEVAGWSFIKEFRLIKPRGVFTKHAKFPCYVDYKYNGRRLCMEREKGAWRLVESGGSEIKAPHIVEELGTLVPDYLGDVRLDSEIQSDPEYYGVEEGEYLDDTYRLESGKIISKYKSTDREIPLEELYKLEVRVFDIVPLHVAYTSKKLDPKVDKLVKRRSLLRKLFRGSNAKFVKLGFWKLAKDKDSMLAYYRHVVSRGGEGVIWKNRDSRYFADVTNEWGKIKHTVTVDLEIVGVQYAKVGTRDEGNLNTLVCSTSDRKLFVKVSSGIRKEEVGNNLENLIGKIIEIKFVNTIKGTKDDKGLYSLFNPSFPNGVYGSLRDDKTKALTLEEVLIAEKEAIAS